MKNLWYIALGALVVSACSPPVHVVLTVRDPAGLAGNASAIDVTLDGGPRRRVDLEGSGFPATVLLVGVSGGREGVVDVNAVDGAGIILAEATTAVRFPKSSTGTAAVDLGISCAAPDSTGRACSLPVLAGGVATQGVCRAGQCISPQCGDGVRNEDLGEACDDGNQSGDDDCTPACQFNVCGDGWAHALDEECDDGNSNNDDGCLNTCELNVCGDGFTFTGVEECDDANDTARDACLPTCVLNVCGDGVLLPGTETCDDGNANPNDACNECELVTWVPRVAIAGNPSGVGAGAALPASGLVDLSTDPRGGVVIASTTGIHRYSDGSIRREVSPSLFSLSPGFLALESAGGVLATQGQVWIADSLAHRVYLLDRQSGDVRLGAGAGRPDAPEDVFLQFAAREALFNGPTGLGVDNSGNVYIADTDNSLVWRLFGDQAEVFAGDETPCMVAVPANAKGTSLCNPRDIAAAPDGTVYISDTGHDRVLAVVPSGSPVLPPQASVYAGAGAGAGGAFNGALVGPQGLAVADDGTLYIADTGNHQVRAVAPGGGVAGELAVAGGAEGFSGDGAGATSAQLSAPTFVVLDDLGVLYILDSGNERVRIVDPMSSTIESVLTLDDPAFVNGTDAATLFMGEPYGVATDGTDVFVSDRTNHRVYRVASDGTVTWLAGAGPAIVNRTDFDTEAGTATAMALDSPRGLSLDGTNLYVADTDNHRIRRIDLGTGMMSTVAGSGSSAAGGSGGDTMQATSAQLDAPEGVLVDSGVIYIADTGNYSLRRVDSGGVIDTIAGTGAEGMTPTAGPPTSTALGEVVDVALAGNGDLYIADRSNATVWLLPTTGDIDPLIDTTDPVVSVAVRGTEVLYATNAGELYSYDGASSTLIGGGAMLGMDVGDGAAAADAMLVDPRQVAVSGSDVWVVDAGVGRVRRIDAAGGTIASVAGQLHPGDGLFGVAGLDGASALVGDGNDAVWAVDGGRLRFVDLAASDVSTIAGYPGGLSEANNSGSSAALARMFGAARGVAYDSTGDTLYVSDAGTHVVHRVSNVSTSPTIEILAGGLDMAGFADATGGSARFSAPTALAWDPAASRLLVADSLNHVIRSVDLAGAVTTLAGVPGQRGFLGDGGDARSALLNAPEGIAVDSDGTLWVSDTDNHRVRRVDSGGTIDTVIGTGLASFPQASGPAVSLPVDSPRGLQLDVFGNLYVASRVGVVQLSPGPNGLMGNILFDGNLLVGDAYCISSVYVRALDDGVWVADACSGALVELQRM